MVRNLPANVGDIRDAGSTPELKRCPGEGHGNPLQYSCLENLMDRGAMQATVHEITEPQTQLKQLSKAQPFSINGPNHFSTSLKVLVALCIFIILHRHFKLCF